MGLGKGPFLMAAPVCWVSSRDATEVLSVLHGKDRLLQVLWGPRKAADQDLSYSVPLTRHVLTAPSRTVVVLCGVSCRTANRLLLDLSSLSCGWDASGRSTSM